MSCPHVAEARLQPPRASQSVHREDCTQCFDSIDEPEGLNVCLSCFNGGCVGERNHADLHQKLSGHPLVLNIRRTKKPKIEREEPPKKMSKLAIAAETESDRYDTHTAVFCYGCGEKEIDRTTGNLPAVIDGVMSAMTFARQTEVQAWEQEINPCEHTLCLEQAESKQLESQNLAHCANCDLKENLWLCLQCGNLGCGRAQFGGVGGNSHGLAHFEATQHPVAVKLGSITPEGNCDIYCYACNDEKSDPEIKAHLHHWGIDIAEREKTEKSLTEMQIEQNLRWEFSMTSEDGKELKPLFGPGLTGLKNLGNSCYLASTLQCLFSLPSFKERYYEKVKSSLPEVLNPADDLETQLRKIADGLLSGRYSKPDSDVVASEHSTQLPHQKGLAPAMLKALIGKGHEEFSTMRQQDAFELLLHLFNHIERSRHPEGLEDPILDFKFVLEQRLQCLGCNKVAYRTDTQDNISVAVPARRIKTPDVVMDGASEAEAGKEKKDAFEPVTIKECLDIFTADELVQFTCKACGSKKGAKKRSGFKTFPNVLAINCRRFELVNWVPMKLDIPIIVEDDALSLDAYRSSGIQPGEEPLPDDQIEEKPAFVPNEAAMAQLEAMGFPKPRCEKALYNTGNADAEQAMNWLFGHMEDPDIDEPLVIPPGGGGGATNGLTQEQIDMVTGMGFTTAQAKRALKEANGNVEAAIEWIFGHMEENMEEDELMPQVPPETVEPGSNVLPANFKLNSIICHKGGSIHAGHYVAFIRKELEDGKNWVLFNDEKVVEGGDVEEMKKFAYVYFFKRA